MKMPTPARLIVPSAHLLIIILLLIAAAPQAACGFSAGLNTFPGATIGGPGTKSLSTDLSILTAEVGEPGHGTAGATAARHTAWWSYTAPENGFLTIDTLSTVAEPTAIRDTVLSIYLGDSVSSLVPVARNDDYAKDTALPDSALSRITIYAKKDTLYRIAVDAFDTSQISVNSLSVILNVRLLPLRKMVRTASFTSTATGINPDTMSLVTYTTTATGSLSGKFYYGAKTYPLAGVFGLDGTAAFAFEQKVSPGADPAPPISLFLDGTLGGKFILTLPNASPITREMTDQVFFTLAKVNPVSGYYTACTTFAAIPAKGFCALTVSPTGAVTGALTTADGVATPISGALHASAANATYQIPFFKSLSAGKGALETTFLIADNGSFDSLQNSGGSYVRPTANPTTYFYVGGIVTSFTILGSVYTKPATGFRALGFLDESSGAGQLKITDLGEISGSVTEPLTFSVQNKFTFDPATLRKPALTLNTATGILTGSINAPYLKKHTISAILSKTAGITSIQGYATGVTANMPFQITP